ncbi:solute carrier family 28 member 3-like isoform X2 [Ptychodera flava]|uniref:solute carrier family 28 member 3-like isoform X2 n=1 Tax=Ptychodera flava TaxID=63121 RepID=UPI00396A5929
MHTQKLTATTMEEPSVDETDKSNTLSGSPPQGDYRLTPEGDNDEKILSPKQNRSFYERVPGDEDMYELNPVLPPTTPPMPFAHAGEDPSKQVCMVLPSSVATVAVPIEDDDTEEELHPNAPSNFVTKGIDKLDRYIKDLCCQYKTSLKYVLYGALLAAFGVYFSIALSKNFQRAIALLVMTVFAVALVLYRLIVKHCGTIIYKTFAKPCLQFCKTYWWILKWVVYISLLVSLIVFAACMGVFHSIGKNPKQLTSAFGIVVFTLFSVICSKRPGWVQWQAVFWGIGLQFLLGVLILRTAAGFESFLWLGDEVSTFLGYSDVGAEFVFSKPLEVHFFVFKVLPTIIFFSYILAMLYYIGVMQWITQMFALVMQYTMGTSGAESLCAAANVFTGMTTAPLVVKPYLKDMTASELHSVLTSGYATIAGSVLGAYIAFGISASHLLSASIISAPAALAVSKIFYPELGRPKTLKEGSVYQTERTEKNIIEAGANGASDGLKVCVNITGQLIAIISTLAFIDAILSWIGGMVDYPELTFSVICRYVLYPVAWLMGVDSEDCYIVAELVGTKTFLNEFVAYDQLAGYIKNRSTGVGPTISVRSEVIATYALCGFSNLGGIAIYIGGVAPLAPGRTAEIALLSMRALVAGTVACLLTACVAGVLYDDSGQRFFDSVPEATVNVTAQELATVLYT